MTYPELAAVVGPNVPNYQGMFLRGHGSRAYAQDNGSAVGTTTTTYASGILGQIQGDAERTIYGRAYSNITSGGGAIKTSIADGVFRYAHHSQTCIGVSSAIPIDADSGFVFDNRRTVPTAVEIRPVNVAVKYIICAKE